MKDLKVTDKREITLKGEVLVADPCYFLPDEVWTKLCDIWFSKKGKEKGLDRVSTVEYKGLPILISGTAYGDGEFEVEGTNRRFGVDSGCMAVVEKNRLIRRGIQEDFDPDILAVTVRGVKGEVRADGKGNFVGAVNVQTDDCEAD